MQQLLSAEDGIPPSLFVEMDEKQGGLTGDCALVLKELQRCEFDSSSTPRWLLRASTCLARRWCAQCEAFPDPMRTRGTTSTFARVYVAVAPQSTRVSSLIASLEAAYCRQCFVALHWYRCSTTA